MILPPEGSQLQTDAAAEGEEGDGDGQETAGRSDFLSELHCYCQSHSFQPSASKGSQVCLQAKRRRPSMLSASPDQCQSLPECTAPVVSPGETENQTKGDKT